MLRLLVLRLALGIRGRDAHGGGRHRGEVRAVRAPVQSHREGDPRDPSRLLSPTWRSRLSFYLVGVVMGAYGTLYLGTRALGLSWSDVGGLVRLLLGG